MNMRILLAENDSALCESYRRLFPRFFIDVISLAVDGHETVEKFHEHQKEIDLILIGPGMPLMSAKETVRQILDIDPAAIIVLVGGTEIDPTAMVEIGIVNCLKTPIEIEELAYRLWVALTETRQLRAGKSKGDRT